MLAREHPALVEVAIFLLCRVCLISLLQTEEREPAYKGRTRETCMMYLRFESVALLAILCCVPTVSGITDKAVFGTKTAYAWVYDDSTPASEDQYMTVTKDGRTCTAVHVNSAFRHGSRYPGADDMTDMSTLRDKLVAHKDPTVATFLETWENHYPPAKEKELAVRGYEELEGIGQRAARRFKTLMQNSLGELEMISSETQRAFESGKAFYAGLTKELLGTERTDLVPTKNNAIVRFYDDCDRLEQTVEENEDTYIQYNAFLNSDTYTNALGAIAERLKLTNASISADEMELLYELCAFDMALYNNSDWCGLMIHEERKIQEYSKDVEDYYEKSYGNDVSAKIGCVLVRSMFQGMDSAIESIQNGQNYTVASLKFGHSDTLIPAYTALGLVRDGKPLLASNMAEMRNRKFKSSIVFPVASGLTFALYSCPGQGSQVDYAVQMFLNELPSNMPQCGGSVCWYDDVRKYYTNQIEHCMRDEECKFPVSAAPIFTHSFTLLSFCIAMALASQAVL